ncbi:hypothetical protein HYR69_04765 [Candidatus Sumerlaeota bacterium]|nr:hypothetical protein [Candidatus Sumerlaeota bacterium]
MLPIFKKVASVRGIKDGLVWNPWKEKPDQDDYMFFHAGEGYFYIFSVGGAGEIQFQFAAEEADDGKQAWLTFGLGFSFGGSFIPDKGVLGITSTPWYFLTFQRLLREEVSFRRSVLALIRKHHMICGYDQKWEGKEIIDGILSLKIDSDIFGQDRLWVSLVHPLYSGSVDDRKIMQDLDLLTDRCKGVFTSCYPIWHQVMRATRAEYGDIL